MPRALRLVYVAGHGGITEGGWTCPAARGQPFEKLTLPRIAALGAGGGLLLYGVLAANAWHAWSLRAALANLTIFVVLGSGSATAALLLARRAGPLLKPGGTCPDSSAARRSPVPR